MNACPFCGSEKLYHATSDSTFKARHGCLTCNRWLEPIQFKESSLANDRANAIIAKRYNDEVVRIMDKPPSYIFKG